MSTAVRGISLTPEAFVKGGLLNDQDVEITEIQFCGFDYDGKIPKDVLAVKADLLELDQNGKPDPDKDHDQYWTAGGDFDQVATSDDGHVLLPGATKTALTLGSNFHTFLVSLWDKGMPKDYLDDGNVGKLKGLRLHVIRRPVPRENFQPTNRRGDGKENETLVCHSILWGPWMGKAKAGTRAAAQHTQQAQAQTQAAPAQAAPQAAPAQAVNGAAAAAVDGDVETTAKASVTQALAEVDGRIFNTVGDLKVAVFRKHARDKADTRNAIVKLVSDPAWLEANGFTLVDGAVIGQ